MYFVFLRNFRENVARINCIILSQLTKGCNFMMDDKFFVFLSSFSNYVANFPSDNLLSDQFDQIATSIMEILSINNFATMSQDIFDELLHATIINDDDYYNTDNCGIEDKKLEFVLNLTSVNVYSSEASNYVLECNDMKLIYNIVYNIQDTRFKGIFPFFDVEFIYNQNELLDEFLKQKIIRRNLHQ